ncbi:MAG: hypothetical protein RDU89_08830 [bacterium]|nr:hypothetical protein [bacterium]
MDVAKPVRAVVEKGPNYIFHLMAVSGVGFQNDYGERYRSTISTDDRVWLHAQRELLSFRDDRSGPLVIPALFLPAYMNIDTAEGFDEYFERLAQGATEPSVFLDHYGPYLNRLGDQWLQAYDEDWVSMGRGLEETLSRLAKIFVRNYAQFSATVWATELPGMVAVADQVDAYFAQRDIVGDWERLTGVRWKASDYQIVLVAAIENGPRANSLGYDRTVFYPYEDFNFMINFISHETGTHILIDVIKAFSYPDASRRAYLLSGGPETGYYDYGLVYRGYENLCRFYNGLVLETADLYDMSEDYRSDEFQGIYQRLHSHMPEMAPLEMLIRAVREIPDGWTAR